VQRRRASLDGYALRLCARAGAKGHAAGLFEGARAQTAVAWRETAAGRDSERKTTGRFLSIPAERTRRCRRPRLYGHVWPRP